MAAKYDEIQEFLRSRADLQARLKLMPYRNPCEKAHCVSCGSAKTFMKEHCWKPCSPKNRNMIKRQ